MNKETTYVISYEHLELELVNNETQLWHFEQIRNVANENKIELNDEDFKRLFQLQRSGEDIEWIMHKMNVLNMSLVDALVSYITY